MSDGLNGLTLSNVWFKYHLLNPIIQEAIEKKDPRIENPLQQMDTLIEELGRRGAMDADLIEATIENLRQRHFYMMRLLERADAPESLALQCRAVVEELHARGEEIAGQVIGLESLRLVGRVPAAHSDDHPENRTKESMPG